MRRPKILVVEDFAPTRDAVEAALTGSYLEVASVKDGREALVYLAVERPDLVLTDFIMPNLDGVSLARKIRQRPDLRKIPIVFLTGADPLVLRRQVHELGIGDILQKPFKPIELVDRLKTVLRTSPAGVELALSRGWIYVPLSALELPPSAAGQDRVILPVSPSELGRTEIVKTPPRLFEIQPVIAPAPSRWDYLPPGASIPEFAGVGRTNLALPEDGAPLGPIRQQHTDRGRHRHNDPEQRWVQEYIGAKRLFDAEPSEFVRSIDAALSRFDAA